MLATINQKLTKLVNILNTNPKYKNDPKSIRLKKKLSLKRKNKIQKTKPFIF